LSEVEIRKCPKCGGELEKGFVHCPRTLDWYVEKDEPLVSMWHMGIAKLRGWRCKKCQLVIFLYGKET
jgi:hypothetical protein